MLVISLVPARAAPGLVEHEPEWFERVGLGAWPRFWNSMAEWRREAGSVGALEPRLLAIVLKHLEISLSTMAWEGSGFWREGYTDFWAEHKRDFAAVAARNAGRAAGRVALYLLGALGPLVLLVVYLRLCAWTLFGRMPGWLPVPVAADPYTWLYVAGTWPLMLFAWLFVSPNATSLHGFYRDRLSRALSRFCREDPTFHVRTDPETGETIISPIVIMTIASANIK